MSNRAAARWLVSGRVQGVGFRWFTVRTAEALGLSGWVSNLADGRVEVLAQGSEEALATLEKALRAGPRLARVENVERLDFPHEVEIDNTFSVK